MSHLDQASALATVDKTPEQREAERQQKLRTEELANWIVRANAARKRFLLLSKLADGLRMHYALRWAGRALLQAAASRVGMYS